jgi:hypothetical protein
LIVSGPVDGVSPGPACGAGTILVSGRMSGNSSLSDFADSFGASAISALPGSRAGSTAREAGSVTTLIAIAGPRPARQKRAIHIVLVIFDLKAFLVTKGLLDYNAFNV